MGRKRQKKEAESRSTSAAAAENASARATSPPHGLPWWKKAAFAAATTLALFACLEVLLWAMGVRPTTASDDPYVGFTSLSPLFVPATGPGADGLMETAAAKRKFFNHQQFPRDKPAGTYRIFCVGGSTTYGRPYDDRTSFCGWLRELLPLADPTRKWEVINCGGISYASYRDALVIDEALQYDADLVIVYGSQNEFLERRTYHRVIETPEAVRGLGALASRTRLFTAVKWAADGLRGESDDDRATLSGEVETRLDRSIGPTDYARDDPLREQIVDHFQFNLAKMVDAAHAAGAKALLVTPASNLRHCSPFKSQHREEVAGERARAESFEKAVNHARRALAAKDPAVALAEVDKAIAIDDRFADAHYLRGQILDALERFAEAKRAYERARDEDVCPLRAVGEMLPIVAEVAASRDASHVDFEALVAAKSPQGIAGKEQFLDHVHPTIAGHRMLAEAIIERLAEVGELALAESWNAAAIESVARGIESRIDRQAQGIALRNLSKVLEWAGKFDESKRLAEQAAELAPSDAETYFRRATAAAAQGNYEEAIAQYQRCLQIDPQAAITYNALGGVYEQLGNLELALAHYRRAAELGKGRIEVQARTLVGGALRKLGRSEEAVRELRQVIALDANHAEAHLQLAMATAAADLPASLAIFAEAHRIEPQNARVLSNWGGALLTAQKYGEAAEKLRAALDLDQGSPQTHVNFAVAMRALGNLEGAERHYREAARLDRSMVAARAGLAEVLIAGHKLDEAQELLQSSDDPRMMDVALKGAWRLATSPAAERRDGVRAVAWAMRLSAATGEKSPEVLDVLAAAHAESGNFNEAVRTANLAVAAALEGKKNRLADDIKARLALYRAGRPFRDASPR